MVEMVSAEEREMAAEMAANFLNEEQSESTFGAPKAGPGMWSSIIRIINPISGNTLEKIQLEQNESVHR
jgi:splicing factor 3B subunit 3